MWGQFHPNCPLKTRLFQIVKNHQKFPDTADAEVVPPPELFLYTFT